MDYEEIAPVLEAIGMAQARDEPLDIEALSRELKISMSSTQMRLDSVRAMGLALTPDDEYPSPMLLEAGRQYLANKGGFDANTLRFLPQAIDNLHAREALVHAGVILVDEQRQDLRNGELERARELVPPAFESAVDQDLAIELFAASVALMARLSAGEPAGCVAEEMITASLIEEAKARLEMRVDLEEITPEEAQAAAGELGGLWELYQDDDVLDMFKMREPADAAVARHDPVNRQMGVADQRIEAWFRPFGGVIPTGYLDEPREHDEGEGFDPDGG